MFNNETSVASVVNNMQSYILHPEFMKLKLTIQHGNTSRYDHSISVMNKALAIANKLPLKVDLNELAIAALLHDFHTINIFECKEGRMWLAFHHPEFAAENAKVIFNVTDRVYNAIKSHMFPFNFRFVPSSLTAVILGMADKSCCIKEKRNCKKSKTYSVKVAIKGFKVSF